MSAITLITSPPTFITPEQDNELTSSTPETFTLIRPVLRAQEFTSVTLDPSISGLSTQALSDGTLYILETALYWWSDVTATGFTVPYKSITLHAISRGESGPTVYCQVDQGDVVEGQAPAVQSERVNGDNDHDDEEDEEEDQDEDVPMTEMVFAPQDPEAVERIFEALSACAALHPDEDLDEGDDDAFLGDAGDFEQFNGAEGEELSEVGRAALAHLESIIVYPEGMQPPSNGSGNGHGRGGIEESDEEPATPPARNPA